jgi:hypothetical protein
MAQTSGGNFDANQDQAGRKYIVPGPFNSLIFTLLPVARLSVLMSNGHDSDVIVCHLVIDRKWKALHQNTTIGSEIRYAHPGIQTQEIQYCAKLVVKLSA